MKEITFNISNVNAVKVAFTKFLKKFNFFDKSILLQIDNGLISAKMTNVEQSVVKSADEVVEEFTTNLDKPIFLPLMISEKIIRSLEFFTDAIQMKIVYDVIDNRNVALAIIFESDSLKLDLPCTKITFFQTSIKVNSEVFKSISEISTSQYNIELSTEDINQIKNLATMTDSDTLMFKSNTDGVFFTNKNKNFNYKISDISAIDKEYKFLKNNIKVLDGDDYDLYMKESSIVLKSKNDNSIVIIAEALS